MSRHRVDISMVGDNRVGKSSLRERLVFDTFTEEYEPMIGIDTSTKRLLLDGAAIKLVAWETLTYDPRISFKTFLLVYDVTNYQSFQYLSYWINNRRPTTSRNSLHMLVGNKCDLEREREVEHRTAEELADSLNIPYIETSAKEGINVELAFVTLAAMWKKQENVPQEKSQVDVKRAEKKYNCIYL